MPNDDPSLLFNVRIRRSQRDLLHEGAEALGVTASELVRRVSLDAAHQAVAESNQLAAGEEPRGQGGATVMGVPR